MADPGTDLIQALVLACFQQPRGSHVYEILTTVFPPRVATVLGSAHSTKARA
jgi:hypothetical protein